MKTKKLLCYSYRVIEILLILSITAGLIALGLNSHDKAEMGGLLSPLIVALVWMWFISLPLLIIFVASFIRSIPPSTSYKKTSSTLKYKITMPQQGSPKKQHRK